MPRYSLHPVYEHAAAIARNLEAKTGRDIDEWIRLVEVEGPGTEKERVAWLKATHGLGSVQAAVVAEYAEGRGRPEQYDPEALVDAQYPDRKAALRPVFSRLLEIGLGLGEDVRACPCATFVPLYRSRVFAQIKPTTNSRIDLGLALGDAPFGGRLIDTGGAVKRDRITHRIALSSVEEIDAEVKEWLRDAYRRDS